jgi:hypothetical protein
MKLFHPRKNVEKESSPLRAQAAPETLNILDREAWQHLQCGQKMAYFTQRTMQQQWKTFKPWGGRSYHC